MMLHMSATGKHFLSRRPSASDIEAGALTVAPDADQESDRAGCPHCGQEGCRGKDGYCEKCDQWHPASTDSIWIPCHRDDPATDDDTRHDDNLEVPELPAVAGLGSVRKSVDKRGGSQNLAMDFGDTPVKHPPLIQLEHRHKDPKVPDLKSYHTILVNSSGGKDSQAMLHHVHGLAKAAGVLDRVHVVHADLGQVEWKGTKDIAKAQADHYGVPFHVVSNQKRDLLQQVEERGMWPSSGQRYCTSDHKRAQIDKLITKMHSEYAAGQKAAGVKNPPKYKVLNCMGLRGAESPARAKKEAIDYGETLRPTKKGKMVKGRMTTNSRTVDHYLPIHNWSQSKVWDTIEKSGAPVHHAYKLGMPRLSCCFCVFATKPALMLAGKHNPELLQKYVDVEKRTGHSFRKDFKIADVQDALKRGEEPGPIKTWEM